MCHAARAQMERDPGRNQGGMTLFGGTGAAIRKWGVMLGVLGASGVYSAPPSENTLKVLRTIPHSGYSEGLDFHDGFLWHALPKMLLKIDPKDGSVLEQFQPASEYSESLTWFQGALWNVSFSDNGIYRGKAKGKGFQFEKIGTVPQVHAWGITHDGKNLIVTGDYSHQLFFLDPKKGKLVRTLDTDGKNLEDLAWDGVGIWTSSFTQNPGQIFRIHPKTGKRSPLFSLPDRGACPVIDGIAFDGKNLWVTGKHCPSLYYIERPSEPLLTIR